MIEIGKQYEIINSKAGNNGRIVTVTGYRGNDIEFSISTQGERWYIDQPIVTNYGDVINHAGELQLKPIDDYDGNRVVSWDELADIWKPEDLKEREA